MQDSIQLENKGLTLQGSMAGVNNLFKQRKSFSIELWPARSEISQQRLDQSLTEFASLNPSFVSITYGAAGSTRKRTHELVVRLKNETSMVPMAHLTCASQSKKELIDILLRYKQAGIDNILAIHGDPPLNSDTNLQEGELHHAVELVELARSIGGFNVAVAAHPEGHPSSSDIKIDRFYLAKKLKQADFGITQFFFDKNLYLDLLQDLDDLGVKTPVLPGIMPITRLSAIYKMAELSGTEVPQVLRHRLEKVQDKPDEIRRIGIEVATQLGQDLLSQGVPGLHFYTMNDARVTKEIFSNLGLVK